jgi:O-succinylbenzoate synthase
VTTPLELDEVVVYAIPTTTRFRGLTMREGMLLRRGERWGEFSPFPEYAADEAATWLASALEQLEGEWPALRRATVPVNCTIPAVEPALAAAMVRASGCRTAKVKVAEPGEERATETARLEAVRDALGPSGALRLDANGGWGVEEAIVRIRELARLNLEYVEQPCATVEELAQVRRAVTVAVAADESVRRAEDPLRVARSGAADLLVLKVQPLGGVRRALALAEEAGLPAVVSSALETSVGLAAGVALAAALPALPYACGLATGSLLAGDVVVEPLTPIAGELSVGRAAEPGHTSPAGVQVDRGALEPHRASPARTRWWHERLDACAHLLGLTVEVAP